MLFSRTDLPGLQGPLRDLTGPKGITKRKLKQGDIAVIDAADIARQDAQKLIDAQVGAVINLSPFSTGKVPNFGPQMLLDAGIELHEHTDGVLPTVLKNGKKARIESSALYFGEKPAANLQTLTLDQAAATFDEARDALGDHMIALSGNLAEFVRSEAPLLVDGLGIPEVEVDMDDRKVIVVSPLDDLRGKLKDLRFFLREYDPILIGVDSAADVLMETGHQPDVIVGDPEVIATDTLRCGATVIVPADPDGHAKGLDRIQDLGVAAMTFPAASTNPTDLAMLLADYHGASMIVNLGENMDLDHVFANSQDAATPSAMLSRLRVGNKLVDYTAVTELYRVSKSGGGWIWAIVGVLFAIAMIVAIAGLAGDAGFVENLINAWNNFALSVQGLFKS